MSVFVSQSFETWHWRMAFASFFVGVIGVALVSASQADTGVNGAAAALGGLAVIAAVAAAAFMSRFWNRVRSLPQPQKSFVWLVAIVGFVFGCVFILVAVMLWNALQDMWD